MVGVNCVALSYYEGFANSAEEYTFYSKGTTKLLEFFKNRMTCTILVSDGLVSVILYLSYLP